MNAIPMLIQDNEQNTSTKQQKFVVIVQIVLKWQLRKYEI